MSQQPFVPSINSHLAFGPFYEFGLTAKCPNSHLSHQSTAIWPLLRVWPDRLMSQQPFGPCPL